MNGRGAHGDSRESTFDQAYRIFGEVCDLSDEEIAAALDLACGGNAALRGMIEEFIASDRSAASGLEAAPPGASEVFSSEELSEQSVVAGFQIVRAIGQGGMGIVYEALQAAPRRTVALKLLRPGLVTADRLRRFRHEAEVLGWLSHPGIARIYASGVADSASGPQPFLAMELVEGERIDLWADAKGLDTEARLELLARVCDAVQHAHQKGVVHRDLKPANILVDASGQPKILDFGIARITDADLEATTQRTLTGEILGTLAYMSPEQVAADPSEVDTRSDVYALGVLTYELVSGEKPYDLSTSALHEAARRITEEDPTTLGVLDEALGGDVEVLVAKAMEKEKEHRYPSAEEFASDIRRHLANEPILARPPDRAYRLRKFAKRNRALVVGLAAVFLTLLAGAITSTSLFLQVRAEARRNAELVQKNRDEAETKLALSEKYRRESQTAQQTVGFLESIFQASNPLESEIPSARELIDRSAAKIQADYQADGPVRGRLLGILGRAYVLLGFHKTARPLLEEAVELQREFSGKASAAYAVPLHYLGNVQDVVGEHDEAEAMLRESFDVLQATLGPEHDECASVMNDLANTLMRSLDDREEAEALYRESLRIREKNWGKGHRKTDPPKVNLANMLGEGPRSAEAETLLREVAESAQSDAARVGALMALGKRLSLNRRYREAETVIEEVVRLSERRYGRLSGTHRRARLDLAGVWNATGRTEEALDVMIELLAQAEEQDGPDAVNTLVSIHDLAFAMHDAGLLDEAETLFRDGLSRMERMGAEDDRIYPQFLHNLGFVLEDQGRLVESEESIRLAYEQRLALLGHDHHDTLLSLKAFARSLRRRGAEQEALGLRQQGLASSISVHGDAGYITQELRSELSNSLSNVGRDEEAATLLHELWEKLPAMKAEWPGAKGIYPRLLELLERTGQVEKAAIVREEAAKRGV